MVASIGNEPEISEEIIEQAKAGQGKRLIRSLILVALGAIILVSAFELITDIADPKLSIFQSSEVDVAFSTVVTVVAAYFVIRGRDKLYLLATQEIVARKRSEEALRQSEAKYRTLFETMAQGVTYQDAECRIASINPAGEKIFGLSRSQILGKSCADIFSTAIHEDGSVFLGDEYPAVAALKTGEPVKDLVVGIVNPPDGKYRWLNINAIPQFRAGERNAYGVYTTFEDITERRQAKQLSDALNDIDIIINSSLDFNKIMETVVVEATKAIGCEAAAIYLRSGTHWSLRYPYELPKEMAGSRFTDAQAKGLVIASKTRGILTSGDTYNDERVNREEMRRYGIRSLLSVPLVTSDKIIGVLSFYYRSAPTSFTDAQINFVSRLGSSLSLALDNARLYELERSIADTLQEAILTIPNKIEGIDFGYLYRSATEAAMVGGDFYDLFELDHGRIGIVIGDVSGKGLEASTITSLMKSTIKAYAYQGDSPASIMGKVNNLMVRETAASIFVTLFISILTVSTGELVYCDAGHPPAILRRSSGDISFLAADSPIIGAFPNLNYTDHETILGKGDVLTLYTDGTIEARSDHEFFGEERLMDLIKGQGANKAQELPRIVFDKIVEYAGGILSDDIALLSVSLEG